MITKVKFEKFTAFDKLEIKCESGINVFIGANGTGKTHILKVIYAACDITRSKGNFATKINNVFAPSHKQIGRLIKRHKVSSEGHIEVYRKNRNDELKLRLSMSNHTMSPDKAKVTGAKWTENSLRSVYIPVKEMLSNAAGFRSLYSTREIAFDETYADIVDRALLPLLKGPTDKNRGKILTILKTAMEGKVFVKNEEFFLYNKQGLLEFSLLAEGLRKLALLWVLAQNGTLLNGSILCWDEPETNLNPTLIRTVVEILLELQRLGVQIFIATHNYVLLKELHLQKTNNDSVFFHSLYRDHNTKTIAIQTTSEYLKIHPNTIADTFSNLYDREIKRSIGEQIQ